jgi:predicted DNA-binding transcriptional regulator AlpA
MPKPIKIGNSVRWSMSDPGKWVAVGCPTSAEWEEMREKGDS